ncbi:putative dihydrolipoyllysine-residue acetyltransferase [Helianthus anomalus]
MEGACGESTISVYSPMYITQGAIMAVGASKPTSIVDKDGYFSVKSQMLVSFSCLK